MNFHDSAFEKAYLQIIKESVNGEMPVDDEVCPDCGGAGQLEDGTPCPTCAGDMEDGQFSQDDDDNEVCPDCGGAGQLEDGTPCPTCAGDIEECSINEADEDDENPITEAEEDGDADAADAADDTDADAADDASADDAEPVEGGKFISFFTTNEDLIKALQDGFAKIAVTGTDDKAEPVEFEADVFENLSVEDLKEDEDADTDVDTDADTTADDAAAEADDADADKK